MTLGLGVFRLMESPDYCFTEREEDLADVAALLAIERFLSSGLILRRAEILEDEVRLYFSWANIGDAVISITPPDERPCYVRSRAANVMISGAQVTRPWAMLMKRIALAVTARGLVPLLERLRPPPPEEDSTPIEQQVGPDGPVTENPQRQLREFDSPINQWGELPNDKSIFSKNLRDFMCDHATKRKFYDTFRFDGPEAAVLHGDLECLFITPRSRAPLPSFFNYPWPLRSGCGDLITSGETILEDLDVIQGGAEKLISAIRHSVTESGGNCPVTVFSTCIPVIIGDDIEGILSQCKHLSPNGIYHISPRTISAMDVQLPYILAARERFLAQGGLTEAGTIALIGFRDDRARAELISLLEGSGIRVTGCMVPELGPKRFEDVLRAEVLVIRQSSAHKALLDRLLDGVERKRIESEAPWGWAATTGFFSEIARYVGKEAEVARVIERKLEELSEERRLLEAKASDMVLAFVIEPGQEHRLIDPAAQTGLPILPVTLELGFPTRVLVYGEDVVRFEQARARLEGYIGVEVLPFITPSDLDRLLEPPVRAVFSEYFYDHRLTRRGLAQFSARDFEIGLDGALRTLKRLIRIATLSFYRDYKLHIAGDADT